MPAGGEVTATLSVLLDAPPHAYYRGGEVRWQPCPADSYMLPRPSMAGTGSPAASAHTLPPTELGCVRAPQCQRVLLCTPEQTHINPDVCLACTQLPLQAAVVERVALLRNPARDVTKLKWQEQTHAELLGTCARLKQQCEHERLMRLNPERAAARNKNALAAIKKKMDLLFQGPVGVAAHQCLKRLNAMDPATAATVVKPMLVHMLRNLGNKHNFDTPGDSSAFALADYMYSRYGGRCLDVMYMNVDAQSRTTIIRKIRALHQEVPRAWPHAVGSSTEPAEAQAQTMFAYIGKMQAAALDRLNLKEDEWLPAGFCLDECQWQARPVVISVAANGSPPQYDGVFKIVCGSCGKKGHVECDPGYHHKVKQTADRAAYDALMAWLEGSAIAKYFRAIMYKVFHPKMPAVPIVSHGTCLKFDWKFELQQLEYCRRMTDEHILPRTMSPPITYGTDGCSPRRKMMQHLSDEAKAVSVLNVQDERYRGDWLPCMRFSGTWHEIMSGPLKGERYPVIAAGSDARHGVGKEERALWSVTKMMQAGVSTAHINHILEARDAMMKHMKGTRTLGPQFDQAIRGKNLPALTDSDCRRKDPMNKKACQRVIDRRTQNMVYAYAKYGCAGEVVDADGGHPLKAGRFSFVLMYMKYTNRWISAFLDPNIDLDEAMLRVIQMIYFKVLWRDILKDARLNRGLNLKVNFGTTECFEDTDLCCHEFLLLVAVARDVEFPEGSGKKVLQFHYEQQGSNWNEILFGTFATWKAQCRVMDAKRCFEMMNAQMRVSRRRRRLFRRCC